MSDLQTETLPVFRCGSGNWRKHSYQRKSTPGRQVVEAGGAVGQPDRQAPAGPGQVEVAWPRAVGHAPSLDRPFQVGGGEELAGRVEGEVINVAVVPGQFAHQFSVAGGPDFYEVVIAARGEELAVRAARKGADPAGVGVEGVRRPRLVAGGVPGQNLAVVAAGKEQFLFRAGQAAQPAVVADQGRVLAGRQVPALNGVVLRALGDELSGGVEPAAQKRAGGLEFLGQVRLRRNAGTLCRLGGVRGISAGT